MYPSLVKRSLAVYFTLIVLGLGVCAWQSVEHQRFKKAEIVGLTNRGRDITSTLGLVVRSQRRFGILVLKERVESALQELVRPGDLESIAILGATGETIASAGKPINLSPENLKATGIYLHENTITLMNLMDLGSPPSEDGNRSPGAIVLSEEQMSHSFRPPSSRKNSEQHRASEAAGAKLPPKDEAPPAPDGNPPPDGKEAPPGPPPPQTNPESASKGTPQVVERESRVVIRRSFFGRPPWMPQEEYDAIIRSKGVNSLVITLATDQMRSAVERDLLLRAFVCLLALTAALISIFAWRNFAKNSDLQIRLVKAAEMNAHLKEMNLASAGLAHETRNPLNLIRGLAQMISMQSENSPKLKEHACAIMEEADRVTVQLNEFINYSKPREAHIGPVDLDRLVADVARTLVPDLEEKQIELKLPNCKQQIEADDQLLRQALFNLLLNATQAVEAKGIIEVLLVPTGNGEACLEIHDNGPGVPAAQREAIFKPYVTMRPKGVGLGLAIVHQIVSSHGWLIRCLGKEPRGALFRISRVKLSLKSA